MSAMRVEELFPVHGRLDLGAPAPFNDVDPETLLPARATADGTLRRMLLSALVLFAQRGYHAVPVREIARGAGIRASSMYEHRASKEKLLLDLMLIGHEEHRAWLIEARQSAAGSPRGEIEAVMRAHVRFHATYPMLARVCNRELGSLSDESLAQVLEVRRSGERLFISIIEAGVDAAVFTVPDSYLATAAIGAMGIRVAEWYRPNAEVSIEAVADAYALFTLRLLGAA
jgi:AcrR family transcriptional regulator